ncbi:hypothetical protein SDC9_20593 [bioreactor metagenome]|uniref:NAD-specific glutamate dehydrogenase n=1 Tax=bioreactor metagenome TaxID=1076179 RepID=A0A644U765_9ZZZZ
MCDRSLLHGAEGEGVGQHLVDVRLFHVALELFRARPGRLQHHVIDGVHAGVLVLRQVADAQHRAGDVLVGLVGDIGAVFGLHRRFERAVHLRTPGLVIIREVAREDRETLRDVDLVRETVAIGVGVVRIAGGVIGADLLAHLLTRLVVVDRADHRDAMGVVAGHHDESVGVGLGEFHPGGNRLVEFDRVDHGAVPVERVGHLVDRGAFDHQEEALGVLRKLVERGRGHRDEARLIGELLDSAHLQLIAVEPAVHVAGVEQAQHLAAVRAGGGGKLGRVGRQRVARVLEHRDVILVILALRAGDVGFQEIGRAAAEDDLGLHIIEHADDIGLVGALAGVGDHRGRGRILDLGGRDDTDRLVRGAAQRLGDGLDLRVVLGVRGAVGIDAERVHPRLVAGHVGRHRVRRVGGDRMGRRRADEGHAVEIVHRQPAVSLAVMHAVRHDPGCGAVGNRKPVADEEDDVLRLRHLRRAEDGPGDRLGLVAGLDLDGVVARRRKNQVAQDQRRAQNRVVLALFLGNEIRRLAEHLGIGLAVHGDGDVALGMDLVELDLEVERRAGEDRGPVERHDRGAGMRRTREHRGRGEGEEKLVHCCPIDVGDSVFRQLH